MNATTRLTAWTRSTKNWASQANTERCDCEQACQWERVFLGTLHLRLLILLRESLACIAHRSFLLHLRWRDFRCCRMHREPRLT